MKTPKGTWLKLSPARCLLWWRALLGWPLLAMALCLVLPVKGQESSPSSAQDPAQSTETPSDASGMAERPEAEENPDAPAKESPGVESSRASDWRGGVNRDAIVVFGQNVELKAGDTAEVVVVIGGSAKIHGKVRDTVVAIGGNIEIDGEVQSEVVSVMGGIHVRRSGEIGGDVVTVGGKLEVEDGATIRGHAQEVAVPGMRMPRVDWIQQWLAHCVLMFRPLAPQVGWVWMVALVYFLLFLLIAAVFRHPVQCCVNELTHRPATTFLMGLLTKLLLPIVIIILLILVVGIVVVPFIIAALFVLSLVGKVAVLEWLGFRISSLFRSDPLERPVVALVIGSAILALLYMIPVVGLLTMLLLSVWSLGCAITAAFGGFRRELPERQPAVPSPQPTTLNYQPAAAPTISSPVLSGTPSAEPQAAAAPSGTFAAPAMAEAPLPGAPPVMPDVLVYPKATFWERLAALFLDVVLIVILGSIVGSFTAALIIGLAYVTGMWTWRGTTIGGIVLGLKVVRMNGEPVSFAVALVRGLAAGFSAIVLFLGFFWIAWDTDKQGWHDKIAGTLVLRLPRGTPLLCF